MFSVFPECQAVPFIAASIGRNRQSRFRTGWSEQFQWALGHRGCPWWSGSWPWCHTEPVMKEVAGDVGSGLAGLCVRGTLTRYLDWLTLGDAAPSGSARP